MDSSQNLAEHGYVILSGVFSADTLKPILKLVDQVTISAEKGLEDPFRDYYLGHRPDQGVLYDLYQRHPEFHPMASNLRVLEEVSSVLGQDVMLYENSLVYKPKGAKNEVPWHQDFISRPTEPLKIIAWMALDDANEDNGAISVLPASHKDGYRQWHRVQGETHHDRINHDDMPNIKPQLLSLNAGDVLLFDARLIHSSPRVSGQKNRRAYRVAYQGMDKIRVPRGAPLVLLGGTPETLELQHHRPAHEVRKSPFRRFINRVGKRLTRF